MLLPLKHIIRLLLFVFLIGNFVACQSWRDAKAVVKEADSLLANGVKDTNSNKSKSLKIEGRLKLYATLGDNLIAYKVQLDYSTHLNYIGAELFTTKLAHDIDSLGLLKD